MATHLVDVVNQKDKNRIYGVFPSESSIEMAQSMADEREVKNKIPLQLDDSHILSQAGVSEGVPRVMQSAFSPTHGSKDQSKDRIRDRTPTFSNEEIRNRSPAIKGNKNYEGETQKAEEEVKKQSNMKQFQSMRTQSKVVQQVVLLDESSSDENEAIDEIQK
jgi:hypothetical protein